MPTPHISAEPGAIAPTVLMPGDPRRAKKIADTYLTHVELVSDVRNIQAFTGRYDEHPVTVFASGMGVPSISIYATELAREYGVKRIVRLGTAGASNPAVGLGDVIVASAAHTSSSMPTAWLDGATLSAAPSARLLAAVHAAAAERPGTRSHFGPVFTTDEFYGFHPEQRRERLIELGTLGTEMEAAGLYLVSMREGVEALAIMIASEARSAEGAPLSLSISEREDLFGGMTELALAGLF